MGPLAAILDQVAAAEPVAAEGQSLLGVALLGVLQGLTEFLPVSSSGHLSLGSALLARTALRVPEAGLAFNVVLHLGTLVAVGAVFGRDLVGLLREALRGRPRDLLLVVLGSVPAGAVGVGLSDWFESFSENPDVAAACLFATSIVLLAGEWARRRNEARAKARGHTEAEQPLRVRDVLVVGCAQAVAILPGISRSGATIAAGLLCGLTPRAAARLSFLLGFVAIAGAALLEVPKALGEGGASLGGLGLGFALSTVVGLLSLKLLLVAIGRGAFRWFALYCGLLGASWFLFLR